MPANADTARLIPHDGFLLALDSILVYEIVSFV